VLLVTRRVTGRRVGWLEIGCVDVSALTFGVIRKATRTVGCGFPMRHGLFHAY